MKRRLQVLAVLLCLATFGACLPGPRQRANAADISLDDLPSIQDGDYRVDPYMAAASRLQALGKEKACKRLQALAEQDDFPHGRVIVLCRMLFAKKAGSKFRRPEIGAASFLADTDYPDWPLEPIELVDGVPFLVTRGYSLGGHAEPSSVYLKYCMRNCDWSSVTFKPKSAAEKRKALEKLLSPKKWKQPLDEDDKKFLSSQIR